MRNILRIDEVLKMKKIQQKTLAERIGVTRVTVSTWCNNKSTPSIETLLLIARELGVRISDLIVED
jgi:transcriptional regulator with XRE-family HTH domain